MKDILLINPPEHYKENWGILNRFADRIAPLNLLFLLSYINANGFKADIIDSNMQKNPLACILERLNEQRYKYIGFTMTTSHVNIVSTLAKRIKQLYPDVIQIAGGVHPTFMPENLLRNSCIDYIVRGEGEVTLLEILQGKKLSEIDGVSYRKGAEIVHNRDRGMIEDLDLLPIPEYERLELMNYLPNPEYLRRFPVMSLMTSRGCHMRCIFCVGNLMFNRVYRMQSYKRMADECELAVKKFNARQIRFIDDNFTYSTQRVEDFCKEIIKRGLNKKMVWMCPSRVDALNEDIVKLMKESGCFLIYFGVESGNEEILKKIHKAVNKRQIIRTFSLMKRYNMQTRASFIIGLPGETKETICQTIEFAREIGTDYASFSIATPYPGTELYEIAKKQNNRLCDEWDNYIQTIGFTNKQVVYSPKGISGAELKKLQRYAMRSFYLHPSVVFKRLTALKEKDELLRYLYILTKYLFKSARH